MTKLLGIDYGRAKVGLATAEASLATPLLTLVNNEKLIFELKKICKSENITGIVCGLPEGELEKEIKDFAQRLEKETGVRVSLHPETLSTKEAIAKLRSLGAKRNKLHNDHVYAAVLILEDFWEQNSVD